MIFNINSTRGHTGSLLVNTKRKSEGTAKQTGGPKRSREKDVEDWMVASVWRVGRIEDRLMHGRSAIRQGSNIRKRMSEMRRKLCIRIPQTCHIYFCEWFPVVETVTD